MILKTVTLCLLSQLLLVPGVYAAAKKDSAKSTEGVLDHVFMDGEIKRTYKIHVPKNRAENAPLLFVLHGMTMTSDWAYGRGFNELADQHGFVVVYPQSLAKTIYLSDMRGMPGKDGSDEDESGKPCTEGETIEDSGFSFSCKEGIWVMTNGVLRWNNENEDDRYGGASDVEFLSQLARHLQEKYQLNPVQTFVAGFSNGGYMSYTLMCQAGDIFRGAAIVAGLMDGVTVDGCAPSGPKPVIHFHGTADSMVPIEGRATKGNGNLPTPSAHETVKYFAKLNNATKEETVKVSANTTAHIYRPVGDGAEARFYRIEGFIHYWPGSPYVGDKPMQDNSGIRATELIWGFFSRY
jgi:polyhydroxybutyrate depolymerase